MRVDKLTGGDLNMVTISMLPKIKKNKESMNMMKKDMKDKENHKWDFKR